jgi:hypothetical protein
MNHTVVTNASGGLTSGYIQISPASWQLSLAEMMQLYSLKVISKKELRTYLKKVTNLNQFQTNKKGGKG